MASAEKAGGSPLGRATALHGSGHRGCHRLALRRIDALAEDPDRLFEDMEVLGAPPEVLALLDWIDRNIDRPLPRLRWRALAAAEDGEALQGAYQPAIGRSWRLLEEEWLAVSRMRKPSGTQRFSGVEAASWERSEEWIDWLLRHTHALDSVAILDDLAILLAAAQRQIGGRDNRWHKSVLKRGARIVVKHWLPGRKGKLPWLLEANRPTLRLLASYIEEVIEGWEDKLAEPAIRLYLRLNPDDEHELRRLLVNRLLDVGRDTEALASTECYPDDSFAETRYGEVLALYRLNKQDEAEQRLGQALADLPLVAKYLVPDRIRRPRNNSAEAGGRRQAWQYREEMRGVWVRTEGALDWLSRQVKLADR